MSKQARTHTAPELLLRQALHRRGLRYRLHTQVDGSVRSKPDIVFRPQAVAIYVDGCFWHRCPVHGTLPAHNGDWWLEKLNRNVERDHENDRRLTALGWTVIRIWEHEDPEAAAARIADVVRRPEIRARSGRRGG
jgi:DNA mismatch endonuclease (patch repair protein)